MHVHKHSAAYRAINAVVLLWWTAFVYVNRRIQRWMMT